MDFKTALSERGISQQAAADLLGVTRMTISRYVSGSSPVPDGIMAKLDAPVEVLIATSPDPVMRPETFMDRMTDLGISVEQASATWDCSPVVLGQWEEGVRPIPGWVRYALSGVEQLRMKRLAKAKGLPWPPVGYTE
jgi:DNA-binding transcriptional regulator YdaS (Cro superfamily)